MRAAADYMAQFRSDVTGFICREMVMSAWFRVCASGRPPVARTTMVLRSFRRLDRQLHVVRRAQRHRPPHRGSGLLARDQAAVLARERWWRSFPRCSRATTCVRLRGDHYAKEWPVESFRRHGIAYTQDAQPKSDLYAGQLLPLLNSRTDRAVRPAGADRANLPALERIIRHGAGDRIDHPPTAMRSGQQRRRGRGDVHARPAATTWRRPTACSTTTTSSANRLRRSASAERLDAGGIRAPDAADLALPSEWIRRA